MNERETTPLFEEPLPPAPPQSLRESPNDDDKLWAALSYLSQIIVPVIVPVIILLSETNKRRAFQRYHAVHSLVLLAVTVLYEIVATIVYSVGGAVTGGCGLCLLWPIFLLPIPLFLYYAYLAYQGQYFTVPYLTPFLRDQKWL